MRTLTLFMVLFSIASLNAQNDECEGAIELSLLSNGDCSNAETYNFEGYTKSPTSTSGCEIPDAADIWFFVTVPDGGKFTIDITNGNDLLNQQTGVILTVFTGSCNELVPILNIDGIACNEAGWPFYGFTPGETVFIRVSLFDETIFDQNYDPGIICARLPVEQEVTCGGQITDLGGMLENYPDLTFQEVTICPDQPEMIAFLRFTEFLSESEWDVLYVYDGPDTSYPQISSGNPPTLSGFPAGGYYGSGLPGPFHSTDVSGCLTIEFLSDWFANEPGWVADVYCVSGIPTLNQWGIVILSLILLMIGIVVIRQKVLSLN